MLLEIKQWNCLLFYSFEPRPSLSATFVSETVLLCLILWFFHFLGCTAAARIDLGKTSIDKEVVEKVIINILDSSDICLDSLIYTFSMIMSKLEG